MKQSKKNMQIGPWTVIGAVVIALFLLGVVLILVVFGTDLPKASTQLTPQITLVDAPTVTPRLAMPDVPPTATPTTEAFLPPGMIGIGAYVQVNGTSGAGLKIRQDPGTSGAQLFIAMDSEVFKVIDGPVESDGYTWWKLETVMDSTRVGWGVVDYLEVIDQTSE